MNEIFGVTFGTAFEESEITGISSRLERVEHQIGVRLDMAIDMVVQGSNGG